MLSATSNSLPSLSAASLYPTTPFSPSLRLFLRRLKPISISISASLNPSPFQIPTSSTPVKNQVYQPFRPPQSPLPPKFRSLDTAQKLEVLSNRLGLWFEYAPLISSLIKEGFTPPTIEEATGISGVQQNVLVVGAQVRDTLVQTNIDPEILAAFDTGGSELLYEIRLLNTDKRAAAARFLVENRLDGKGAQDLARAMKDFPRRRGEKGWESFDYDFPGDCLAFMYYRQSLENKNLSEARTAALEESLRVVQTEKARTMIMEELKGEGEEGEGVGLGDEVGVRVPVVRLKYGEVAESNSVVLLPVCRAEEGGKGIAEAPWECKIEGDFGIVVANEGWNEWVVLPGWEPVAGFGKGGRGEGGVVIAFRDGRVLPWKVNKWYNEEAILVVVDRNQKGVVADDGFYLAGGDGSGDLKVQKGNALKELGVKESLGTVVLVVRPPKDTDDDQLKDEDWD